MRNGHGARDPSPAPRPRRLGSPTLRALAVTLAGQVVVAAGTLILYRLLARELGRDAFASYSLIRQAATLLFPVVTVGLVGGLPRYLAMRQADDAGPAATAFLRAATVISASVTVLAAGVALLAPRAASTLLFGAADRSDLVPPFAALLGATAPFYLAYGWFRGRLQIGRANVLQAVGMGIVPPLLLVALDIGVRDLVLLSALVLGGASLGAIAPALVRGPRGEHRSEVRSAGRTLFGYGARRVPGEIAQVGLFALVPIAAAHFGSLRDVAFLAAGLQVLALLAASMNPLGVVLLPTLARNLKRDWDAGATQVRQISAMALQVGVLAGGQLLVLGDVAARAWLGPAFADAGPVLVTMMAGAPFFAYYLTMRSSLDAAALRSYNSRSNLTALAVFATVEVALVGAGKMDAGIGTAIAFAAGLAAQGTMTFLAVRRLFGLPSGGDRLPLAIGLAALAAAAALLVRLAVGESGLALVALGAIEVVLVGAWSAVLVRARVPWTVMLTERLRA